MSISERRPQIFAATVSEIFSNSLIINEDKTKEITTVKEVGYVILIIIKFGETFARNFSKNY